MPEFDVDGEEILVFDVGGEYLFTHYFDGRDVFDDLSAYYDRENYRFEVPESAFDEVRERLAEAYFEPVVVEDLEPYCVVKEKYTKHADTLRDSVVHWERDETLFFLMKDAFAVEKAVQRGATPIEETDYVVGL